MLIENLVFAGSGKLVPANVGVVKALKDNNILKTVKHIAGVSSGSLVALVLGLGYSYEEILDILHVDFSKFSDSSIASNLLSYINPHMGVFSGEALKKFINEIITKKFHEIIKTGNPTFEDLFNVIHESNTNEYRFRHIYIVATDMKTHLPVVFSYYHSPQNSIADAIYDSMCFPFMNKPRSNLIDGGISYNYPIDFFDTSFPNPRTLGFHVDDNSFSQLSTEPLASTSNYVISLIKSMLNAQYANHKKNEFRSVFIKLDNVTPMIKTPLSQWSTPFDLSVTETEKIYMRNQGEKATKELIDQIKALELANKPLSSELQSIQYFHELHRNKLYSDAKSIYTKKAQNTIQLQLIYDQDSPAMNLKNLKDEIYKYYAISLELLDIEDIYIAVNPYSLNEYILGISINNTLDSELKLHSQKTSSTYIDIPKLIILESNDFSVPRGLKNFTVIRDNSLYEYAKYNKSDIFREKLSSLTEEKKQLIALNYRNSKKENLFHKAAEYNNIHVIETLFTPVSTKEVSLSLLKSENIYGELPIHIAAANNHKDVIKCILNCMGNTTHLNLQNKFKMTPLHLAAWNNHRDVSVCGHTSTLEGIKFIH